MKAPMDRRYKDMPHICVCICTYRRRKYLEKLLVALQTQKTDDLFEYSIIVVDNDDRQSAKTVVDAFGKTTDIDIRYFNEPEQNIALARNMAVEQATGDFIAFIDDDEYPIADWLLNLFGTIREYGADGILGPVIPYYETDPPAWIIRGRFYERPAHRTGTVLEWQYTRTGNVLLKKDLFQTAGSWFKAELGSGGEDRDFFRRMIARGHRFVWCEKAPVYEIVPSERLKRSFMLRRAILRGKKNRYKGVDLLKSILAVPIYTAILPVLLFSGHHVLMKYLIKDCDHIGRILSFAGINPVKQKYITE